MSTGKGTIQVNGAERDRRRSAAMAPTDQATMTHAVSRDGTQIAYWTSGEGPPLVLVHGMTADHTRWRPLLPYLEPHATVHAMDRRGRGASGDGPRYELACEFEDVAAVVDAVAEASGSTVDVLGHSHGGICAFGATALTSNIGRLVLYEGWPVPNPEAFALPPGVEERMDALVGEGKREAALELMFREVVQMPEEEFTVYRALPAWQARVAAAHTITREVRAELRAVLDPVEAANMTVPTLLLVGGDSPDFLRADYEVVAAALPDAQVVILDGQQHIAIDLIPEAFAGHVLGFLRDQPT
jgi:pimeloyl-ACP methyl ester carboxylesterase